MEESNLRAAAANDKLTDYPLGPGLRQLYQSAPTLFYCPSRRTARPYPFKREGNGRWSLAVAQGVLLLPAVTKSDYAANSGDARFSAALSFDHEPNMWVPDDYDALQANPPEWTDTNDPESQFFQSGISFYRSQVRPAQVEDGLSNTYLCGEKFLSPSLYEDVNHTDGIEMMGENQSAWVGYEWDNHRVAWNPEATWQPDDYQPSHDGAGSRASDILAFGSAHSGGMNMAFCDGSVRTVSYDVDRDVHRFQANRLDGEAN